jgi:filamentous hemagglutinin family protein
MFAVSRSTRSSLKNSVSIIGLGVGLAVLGSSAALANPAGGTVASGSATISTPSSKNTQIDQKTQNVVINWKSFDIGAGETTQFNQPNSNATAVNRIGSANPTQIFGNLQANGRVVLINGNGMLIGKGAKINTGSFIASASNTSGDGSNGKLVFDVAGNPTATITNQGSITANSGMVALVAPNVSNSGTVSAKLGSVNLGAASKFTVDFAGDGLVSFATTGDLQKGATVSNSGSLIGKSVNLTARAAQGFATSVVNTSGIIQATSVSQQGGAIVIDGGNGIVRASGTLNASGTTGGSIAVMGSAVHLTKATLDASGKTQGGSIALGGGRTLAVDNNSRLDVSATDKGNAGVIYANSLSTAFNGQAVAKGGAQGGDGGFIETSGHTIDFSGSLIDTGTSHGKSGLWLIDPDNFTIDAAQSASIQTGLLSGDVLIQTTSAGDPSQPGNILVQSNISWSSAHDLTLSSYNNILIGKNRTIASSGAGSLMLYADNTSKGSGRPAFNTGAQIAMSGSGNLSIFYDPISYATPTDFSANVTMSSGAFNPYMLVNTLNDLQNISTNLTGTYALGRDINASATAGWNSGAGFAPIGGSGPIGPTGPFLGIFDGEGHTISNLTINRPTADYVGLFGNTLGQIGNLTMTGANIVGQQFTGMLAGFAQGHSLSSISVSGNVSGTNFVGGLAGAVSGILITSVASHGTVTGTGDKIGGLAGSSGATVDNAFSDATVLGRSFVGGLVGRVNEETINNSAASGNVTGLSDVGGLVGVNYATVTNSVATGGVSGTADSTSTYIGGFVGENDGTIQSSFSTGTVKGNGLIGGFAGANFGMISQSGSQSTVTADIFPAGIESVAGGFVGWNSNGGAITGSWATGDVSIKGTESNEAGGFVGENSSSITSSWSGGNVTSAGGSGTLGGFAGESFGTHATIADAYSLGAVTVGGSPDSDATAGGFAGSIFQGSVDSVYAAGQVTGGNGQFARTGGFVGEIDAPFKVRHSYFDMDTTGQAAASGNIPNPANTLDVTGIANADAYTQSTYFGLPFTGTWLIIDGFTRPFLQSEIPTDGVIRNTHQLQLMSHDLFGHYTLANDLKFTGAASDMWKQAHGFAPLATHGDSFYGTFDGAGHTIDHLSIYLPDTDEVGLFGQLSGSLGGSVTNLNLTNVNISGQNNVGALAGDNQGSRIDNVTVSGAGIFGQQVIGGFFGRDAMDGMDGDGNPIFSITNSSFDGFASAFNGYIGGLVGNSYGNYRNVSTSGSVNSLFGSYVGGIIGYQEQGGLLSNAHSTSEARAINGDIAGGLVGYLAGTVEWSNASGEIHGSSIGGLAGVVEDAGSSHGIIRDSYATGYIIGGGGAGGLVGENHGEISDSYSSGNVIGSVDIGGFAGVNSGSITNAYSLGNATGIQGVGGFIGYNSGSVTNGYSTGLASLRRGSDPALGASIGHLAGGVITNLYYDSTINRVGPSRTAVPRVGKVDAGIKVKGVFALASATGAAYMASSYNFLTSAPDHWIILDGETRPMLAMEYSTTITNAHQLQLMGYDPTAHYTLANDINLMDVLANRSEVWNYKTKFAPIGLDKDGNLTAFNGEFDGAGHMIDALSIVNSFSGVGLFGELGGSIHDFALTNVSVSDESGNSIGSAVGYNISGAISNVRSSGIVHGGANGIYVGGLVGANGSGGRMIHDSSSATVDGLDQIGGLVGTNKGLVLIDFATGHVTATGGSSGGLVGSNGRSGTIASSWATGDVTADDPANGYAGGLVGENSEFGTIYGGTISRSWAGGSVTSQYVAGGLVGLSTGGVISQTYATGSTNAPGAEGGLVGEMRNDSRVTQSWASGPMAATGASAGGVVGYVVEDGPFVVGVDGFYDMDTTGQPDNGYGTPLTTDQAMQAASYVGWDFSKNGAWVNFGDNTRPFLRSEYSTTIENTHQLQLMQLDLSAHYILNTDLVMNFDQSNMWRRGFVSVGSSSHPFTGTLDGNSHAIDGLFIVNKSNNAGLFGVIGVGGVVQHLTLISPLVLGGNNVGAIAGLNNGTLSDITITSDDGISPYAGAKPRGKKSFVGGDSYVGGIAGQNGGTGVIENVRFNGLDVRADGNYVGGIVGSNAGQIRNADDAARFVETRSGDYVGGVAGYNAATGVISNSSVEAEEFDGDNYVGGIAGRNAGLLDNVKVGGEGKARKAKTSESGGSSTYIITDGDFVGGIAGRNDAGATIMTAAFNGEIFGESKGRYTGGVVGYNAGLIDIAQAFGTVQGFEYVGGFAGANVGSIMNAYVDADNVQGYDYVGGFVGYNVGSIASVYSYTDVNGSGHNVGGFAGRNKGTVTDAYWIYEDRSVNGDSSAKSKIGTGSGAGIHAVTLNAMLGPVTGFDPAVWQFAGKKGDYLLPGFNELPRKQSDTDGGGGG